MAVYCTSADLESRLSETGVDLRIDDDVTTIDDVIDEASSYIDEHLARGYSLAGAADNRWVKHCTADIALFLLCERRGNPPPDSVQAKFERRMKSLERALAGTLAVPGLARLRTAAPMISQPRIKLGPVPHVRIERHRGPNRDHPRDYPQRVDRTEHPQDYQ